MFSFSSAIAASLCFCELVAPSAPEQKLGPETEKLVADIRAAGGMAQIAVDPDGAVALAVSLDESQIKSGLLDRLPCTARIKQLRLLFDDSVAAEDLKPLARLGNLEELNLSDSAVTDDALIYVEQMGQLQELNLQGTSITSKGMFHLEGLKNLRVLYLQNTKVSDSGLKSLRPLGNLEELYLPRYTSGAGLKNLESLSHLETLGCSFSDITDDGLKYLERLPLKNLSLPANAKLTNAGMVHLRGLTDLEGLNLNDCQSIGDAGLRSLKNLKKLETLAISGSQTTDEGLATLGELTDLHFLSLRSCSHITDNGLKRLQKLTKLEDLDLTRTEITDAGLDHLKGMSSLVNIDFSETWVTETGVNQLKQFLSNVEMKYRTAPYAADAEVIGRFERFHHYASPVMPCFVRILPCLSILLLGAGTDSKPPERDLGADLAALDAMRKGLDTPADEVERRGADLLTAHPAAADQGQIYFHLAHILAQSGMKRPEKVQEYAQRALKLPLQSAQRLTLYVYLGDSYRRPGPAKQFPDKRRQAAVPYLEGLNEAAKYGLPDQAPDLPVLVISGDNSPMDQAAALAARQKALQQRDLCKLRDVLANQIATMYNRRPFATEELTELAKTHLDDNSIQDQLLAKVKDAVAKVGPPKTDADRVLAGEPISPAKPADQSWGRWLLTFGSAAVLLVVFGLVFFLGWRKRRKAGSP